MRSPESGGHMDNDISSLAVQLFAGSNSSISNGHTTALSNLERRNLSPLSNIYKSTFLSDEDDPYFHEGKTNLHIFINLVILPSERG